MSHVLSTGGFFPREYAISYLRLVQRLRLSGAMPLFPPIRLQGVHKDNSSFCLLLQSKLCQHARYQNSKCVQQSSTSYSSPRLPASKSPMALKSVLAYVCCVSIHSGMWVARFRGNLLFPYSGKNTGNSETLYKYKCVSSEDRIPTHQKVFRTTKGTRLSKYTGQTSHAVRVRNRAPVT